MAWNQPAFESACWAFVERKRKDGFVDFEDCGEAYQRRRDSIEETIDLYRSELQPLIHGAPGEFLNTYHKIGQYANSLGLKGFWPTTIEIPDDRKEDFGRVLQELLRPDDIFEAFGRYGEESYRLLGDTKELDESTLRFTATCLMMLHRPRHFVHAYLKVWNAASKRLLGYSPIIPGKTKVDGNMIRRCQELAEQVRDALDSRGLRPRDMSDVQNFLWALYDHGLAGQTFRAIAKENPYRKNSQPAMLYEIFEQAPNKTLTFEEALDRGTKEGVKDVKSYLEEGAAKGIFQYVLRPNPLATPPSMYQPPSFDEICDRIWTQGMRIDRRTLRRYHSAMRTRGFVILAGPSGTGKTWLTSLYAKAVGAKSVAAPVAPNWASNEDLLGYFNPIEDKFHATSFLEFIDSAVEAWERSGKDAPEYHLVLDEMNLARIEHYFSLFLSLMERRREMEMPEASMTGRPSIRIPPNLKFAGTVNMDETTHGFADKVFDRAQLIELSIDQASAHEHISRNLKDEPAKALIELWDAMAKASPVGFRVLDDIADYLEEADKCDASWQEALDDQIVSKLLPKLRGIDPETSEALKGIADLAKEGPYPLAAAKCEEMLRRHERTDVVSFF